MSRISLSIVAAAQYNSCVLSIEKTLEILPHICTIYWCSDIPYPKKINVPVVWIRIKPYKSFLISNLYKKMADKSFDDWYSYISIRLLPSIVDSDYDIHVQNDGWPVNKHAWTDDFLFYDYIGAVWPHMHSGNNIGNGGFSLRSRKLYDGLLDWFPSRKAEDWQGLSDPHYHRYDDGSISIPEDALIAGPYRKYMEKKYNLKWANEEIANRWSLEYLPNDLKKVQNVFGFHGSVVAKELGITLTDRLFRVF